VTEPVRRERGYADAAYVASLGDFGTPVRLPRSSGWLLERPIPGTHRTDAMGPYPIFSCTDWSALDEDLSRLEGGPVSVVLVADPLGTTDHRRLRKTFPDQVVAFKRHLIRDLGVPAVLPAHHRRRLRRAARSVDVEVCEEPLRHLDEWVELYSCLAARHAITGLTAFSRESFHRQLQVPGMSVVRAERAGMTVGMALWLSRGDDAYYHLGASSPAGYEVGASYALFAAAFDHLRERGVRQVDLGGTAGPEHREDGLHRFKSGWANADRPAYLCGRVLDPAAYAALLPAAGTATTWFPGYRSPALEASMSSRTTTGM
jgi:hypothetical protein